MIAPNDPKAEVLLPQHSENGVPAAAGDAAWELLETITECVKMIGPDGTLLHVNSSGLQMVGATSAAAIVGKNVYDLVAPEFKDAFRAFNERICAGEKGSLEYEIINLRNERHHLESDAVPVRMPDGTLAQLATARDVMQRNHSERATLLLAAIVDSSDDAIISKDLNGTIMSWNRSAERVFGYTADEAIGKSVTILIPEDRQDEEPKILSRLRRGERVDHFETIRRRKDGTLLDISLTISPVRDAQGRIIGASKIARDVSDRKRIEKAIQELNAQLTADLTAVTRMQQLSTRLVQADDFPQLLGEIVEAGIEITGADMGNIQLLEDGALKVVSQRGFEQRLLNNKDLDGESIFAHLMESRERVVVEDVANSSFFSESLRDAMLEAGVRAVQSTPLISRSGQVLGTFSTYYRTPPRSPDGDLRLLDVLARQATDLIERKRAEMALLESEGRFRQLADSMPQIVWTARPDGFSDYYNERWYQFTGASREQFGDTSWEPFLHPDDAHKCYDTWYESVRTGKPYEIEYRLWDRNEKRWRWFMGRALPVRDEEGNITKWFGTGTDIDDVKRVEDELRRANHDLEQFAFSASHDLQEPLRGIKINSQLLSRRYGTKLDGPALEFLRSLIGNASRMETLIHDLLAYTQVARIEISEGITDANDALADTLASLNSSIVESGVRISSEPLPSVRIHETHLKQLFQNLVGNAIKYRSRERVPTVHVSAMRQAGNWLFSVADNGIGIEPEYKERVFGLFKRLHTSDEYSGTGIGLALCQRIVERYHGRIWVESEPGCGSKFAFTLPV